MTKRRLVLGVGLIVLTANFVWIPWVVPGNAGMAMRRQHLRSGFVWNGPKIYPTDSDTYRWAASLGRPNIEVLVLRAMVILGILGAVLLLMPRNQKSSFS